MNIKHLLRVFSTIAFLVLGGAGLLPTASGQGQAVYEDYTFTTLAGPPEAGAGWYDGATNKARFNLSYGVAVDGSGNRYVADTGNHTIRKITPAGVVTTLAGLAGASGTNDGTGSEARFSRPYGVAVDNGGNVYVVDTYNHTIRKITAAGVVTTLAGLAGTSGTNDGTGGAARFYLPCGVAVDSNTNLYVADTENSVIRKITSGGVVSTLAGLARTPGVIDGTGSGARFAYPQSVAVANGGDVFVADTYFHMIRKITSAGVVTTLAGAADMAGSDNGTGSAARFQGPFGVAVDSGTNVYVADTYNHIIRKITPGRVVTTLAGDPGIAGSDDGTTTNATFYYPGALAVDGSGNVFVADTYNCTMRKVTPVGVVTTLEGFPEIASGTNDGTGSAARFTYPRGVAVDGGTNVYAADSYNQTVRKITPGGVVTTLAGLAGVSGTNDGTGSAARFHTPIGLAVDSSTNIYVADDFNQIIRKITPAGVVTTLAGLAGALGTNDGTGSAARFSNPWSLAVDGGGNVYVADYFNHAIRKITQGGVVTTLAGLAGTSGTNDGTGSAARFNQPGGVAVDSGTNVYVAEFGNHTIRKITPGGVVTTLAGLAGVTNITDGTGSAARFNGPIGIAVGGNGNIYVADFYNSRIRKVTPGGVVTTLAGASAAGDSDGTGSGASFNGLFGVAVDPAGNLYVGDAFNDSIRKGNAVLTDAPVVDAAVGSPGVIRHLDVTNLTTTSWSWRFIRQPAASSAQLSSTTARNPTFTPDVADTYILQFKGTDNSGRVAMGTVTIVASGAPDTTKPTLEITSPTPGEKWYSESLTVRGTASDNLVVSSVKYQLNGGAWLLASGTTAWSALVSLPVMGTNTVRAYAVDISGNISFTNSVSFLRTNDTVIPTVTITSPTPGQEWYSSSLTVTGTASDNTEVASVSYQLNDGAWLPASGTTNWSASVTLTTVINTIRAYAVDILGNISATNSVNFLFTNDVVKPTVTITSPTPGQRSSSAAFTVRGMASDNASVLRVVCQLNDNTAVVASGTTSWSAKVTLAPGNNIVYARAMDSSGNLSDLASVSVIYVMSDPLVVLIHGQGTVSPNYSNQALVIGKSYTLTARPAAGNVLSNWTDNAGTVLATTEKYTFVMGSSLILNANFIRNPFTDARGRYAGLVCDTNDVAFKSSGFFTAILSDKGSFSSKLILAGKTYPLSGKLSLGGVFQGSIVRKGLSPLSVRLEVDLAGGKVMTGSVSDGTWTAGLAANRAVYSAIHSPPQAGKKYTLIIPGSADASPAPGGYGFGALSVDVSGNATFKGALGDGAKAAQKTFLSEQGRWPFYLSLYSGRGVMLGWLTITNGDLAGRVYWIKQPQSAVLYPSGFDFAGGIEVSGSIYAFTAGVPLLNANNVLILEDGNLPQSLTSQAALGTNNKLTGTNKLSVTITTSSGLFKGSVPNPDTGKSIRVSGALLQKEKTGYGYFLGTDQTGSVFLGPAE